MKMLKKLRSSTLLILAFGFLFVASVSSCGGKKEGEEATEQVEATEEAEHPTDGAEHPTDTTSEHPADTTATN